MIVGIRGVGVFMRITTSLRYEMLSCFSKFVSFADWGFWCRGLLKGMLG